MNGDGSEKIDDGTVDGAPPRAGICRCFALTHCRSTGIKPILKCLLFCPYRNTVREHDPSSVTHFFVFVKHDNCAIQSVQTTLMISLTSHTSALPPPGAPHGAGEPQPKPPS